MRSSLARAMVISGIVMHVVDPVGMSAVGVARRRRVGHGVGTAHRILGRMVSSHAHMTELRVSCSRPARFRRHRTRLLELLATVRDRRALTHGVVPTIQCRPLGRVPVLVPVAQVQSDKGARAVVPVAPVNLLGVVVQLMPVAISQWLVESSRYMTAVSPRNR